MAPHFVSIVDDDVSVREALKGLVRSLGYAAETYESAEAFLQSPRVPETSCVISDIQMPGISGFDLRQRLRADGHATPIIFLTGHPEMYARAQADMSDTIGCLKKPFVEDELIALMDRAMPEA